MKTQEVFWRWFVLHEQELSNADVGAEKTFDSLAAELQKVDPHLTFELGPKAPTRDFIVSAGGIRDSFEAVELLVEAAPPLAHWNVIAFRPRRDLPCVVEVGERTVNSEDVQFSLLDNGKMAGVRLFIPGYQDEDLSWKQAGYLLLDEALGEHDVETRIGFIGMYPPTAQTKEKRYPLSELPSAFDVLLSRLAG